MDLTGAEWRKSRYGVGNCVEVARKLPGIVAIRDSKDRDGPTLVFAPDEWDVFLAGARSGEFDLT